MNFDSIYSHGFVRAAVCIPHLKVAEPGFNADRTIALARRAADSKAAVVLFPELGLSAYTCDDLFHQEVILDACVAAVARVVEASADLAPVLLVGAPLRFEQKLFNCAVVIHRGVVLGIVPKTYLPNYREFYEKRQFASATAAVGRDVSFNGATVPFGNDLVFDAVDVPHLSLFVEICEDLWTPVPPSSFAALAGATVLANLSASNITIAKDEYRRELCAMQSGRCIAAYLYACAGQGESTTDLAWDGHALIYENHELLANAERFSDDEQIITADIDLERLVQDRMRTSSFGDSVAMHMDAVRAMRRVPFTLGVPSGDIALERRVERYPYVPGDQALRDERCYEAYNIQVAGLLKRLAGANIKKVVIGISGGLDSTHALIVTARTMDRLGLPRTNILAYTMPGFATSDATRTNAWALMKSLGVTAAEVDIRPSCMQMLKDIDHPFADGEPVYDTTFENVQAGERTSHLFRLANHNQAIVIGTGDLSELALGWCTYGVGDHMSHYNVNASVPKTLVQHLIRWVIDSRQFDEATSATLTSILETEISPELVPGDTNDRPAQSTEEVIGPYELQDFNIYYVTRFGFRPSKVAYLSRHAWGEKYDLATIKRWLGVFLFRFFLTSQFKRTCVPNSPKVGSGGSLSPRGDWRAPSDAEARAWLAELDNIPG